MRILLKQTPEPEPEATYASDKKTTWGAKWIKPTDRVSPPFVCLYRLHFEVESRRALRIHVSADERYELWLDGRRLGRGPERGDRLNWFFDSFDLNLSEGEHGIVARVWAMGESAACAQISCNPGFILRSDDRADADLVSTGHARWECMLMRGVDFIRPSNEVFTGPRIQIDGTQYPWGWETGDIGGEWLSAGAGNCGNDQLEIWNLVDEPVLRPALLPPAMNRVFMGGKVRHISDIGEVKATDLHEIPFRRDDDLPDEHQAWQAIFQQQGELCVKAFSRRRILVDLETYLCAYPEVVTSGGRGARISIHWTEALYENPERRWKGQRNAIEGKVFTIYRAKGEGIGDVFCPDGGNERRFDTLWWECGRYVELQVETADEPLVIHAVRLHETRYPLEMESRFKASDPRLERFSPLGFRTLQMCSHETYMDCPYYEQLMYTGDTRLEALVTYVLTRDAKLPRKSVEFFDASRLPGGLTQSRYPSRLRQIIPPFSLWWIGMVRDYALWRGDLDFVRERMSGVRGVIDAFLRVLSPEGVVGWQRGWNFVDWAENWKHGCPPGAHTGGLSAPLSFQLLLALGYVAELETWLGEPELAHRAHRLAARLAIATDSLFWDEERGLWADDPQHKHYSEHSQCMALLAGDLFADEHRRRSLAGLLAGDHLTRCTIYFSHYKMEALYKMGECVLPHMEYWWALSEQGFVTTPETPEPSRSDCHAWGAHPLYHFYASVLGIRPTSPGFGSVHIKPVPGHLTRVEGSMVHPGGGSISVLLEKCGAEWSCRVTLPEGVSGVIEWGDVDYKLAPIQTKLRLPACDPEPLTPLHDGNLLNPCLT